MFSPLLQPHIPLKVGSWRDRNLKIWPKLWSGGGWCGKKLKIWRGEKFGPIWKKLCFGRCLIWNKLCFGRGPIWHREGYYDNNSNICKHMPWWGKNKVAAVLDYREALANFSNSFISPVRKIVETGCLDLKTTQKFKVGLFLGNF